MKFGVGSVAKVKGRVRRRHGSFTGKRPAMIAESLGIYVPDFRVPNFSGKGGLPLNIEGVARELEEKKVVSFV